MSDRAGQRFLRRISLASLILCPACGTSDGATTGDASPGAVPASPPAETPPPNENGTAGSPSGEGPSGEHRGTGDLEPEVPTANLTPLLDVATLLSTAVSPDPTRSRATLRNDATGVIQTFELGEEPATGLTITRIARRFVEFSGPTGRFMLAFAKDPVHFGEDDRFYPDLRDTRDRTGTLDTPAKLPEGRGYRLKNPALSWGTRGTIGRIGQIADAYVRADREAPPFTVGDISRRGGGPLLPHVSHRTGLDVDLGYVWQEMPSDPVLVARPADALDRERTFTLVRAVLDTGAVEYVFMATSLQRALYEHAIALGYPEAELREIFQYPRTPDAAVGIIRDLPGHDDHFHVRFWE